MRVKGSVVVVTGASSGIGRATALAFARRGASVVLAARREAALEEAAVECRAAGADAVAVPTDVTDAKAVDELARRAVEGLGRIDAWVNAAAVTSFGSLGDTPVDDVRRVLDVNVMGCVHGARAALPHMRAQGRGVLVNVSSVVGVVAQPYTAGYSMSKHAVRALSASLRQELRLDGVAGVEVCTVLPAAVDTPLFEQAANYTGRRVVAMPPVFPADRVARAIVQVVRRPRREAVVGGAAARAMVLQSKLAPGLMERLMAVQVDRAHLSRDEPAPVTPGNLYDPAPGTGSVGGGWGGRRRTAARRIGTGAAMAAAVAARRRGR